LENLLVQGKKYRLDAFLISETDFYEEFKEWNLKKRWHQEKTCDVRDYIYEVMLKTKVLILDDIWTIDITKAFYSKVKSLLDYRLKKWLKTIFISNFQIDELKEKMEARLFDRLLKIIC
jgi:DNA replication protein DnaC